MFTKSYFPALLLIIFLLSTCTSIPIEKPHETFNGSIYYTETKNLLLSEMEYRFWQSINQYSTEYPDETERLLIDYSNNQKDLIRYYLDKNEPQMANFHFVNLNSVPEDKDSFFPLNKLNDEIRDLYKKKYDEGRASLFSFGTAAVFDDSDLTAFNQSLAEIHVQYHWENKEGIDCFNKYDMAGSGFLITPSHVLTAFHVVSNVFQNEIKSYNISLKFGERLIDNVSILSWDSLTDLAVLELPEPIEIPFLYNHLVNSDDIKQGDTVYALGHPYGYVNTFSKGIVSSARRNAPEWGSWIQIDASVGPGSSGGFLLNEKGKIAGLVVAGINGEEMNFAIPSSLIKKIIDPMINGITIKRPWSGILFRDEKNDTIIKHIFEESPLVGSSVESGDSLIAINDIKIDSLETAKNVLDDMEAGNMVAFSFANKSVEKKIWIKLMRRPDYAIYNKIERMDILERVFVSTGVELQDLGDPMDKVQIGENNFIFKTYFVYEIDQNSYLYSQGIRKGDKLGLIEDYFDNMKYHLRVIHIPGNKKASQLVDPGDMIFTIVKGKYNEYIF